MESKCEDKVCSDDDEDLSDSDGQALRRFAGQHLRVCAVVEKKVWQIDGLVPIDDNMDLKDILQIIHKEQENERKRRVSFPYRSDKDITDLHIQNRTRRLSDLHEELFRLFSINTAVIQRKFEKQRLVTEANKQLVHEELLRKFMIQDIKEAVEIERQERIKTLQEMAEGKHDSIYEIADTNAKLSNVHKELKRIFHYIEEDKRKSESKAQNKKEMLKSRMRGFSKRKLSKELDEIKQRKLKNHQDLEATEKCRHIVKSKLKEVQDELTCIFDSYRNRAIKEAGERNAGKNNFNNCEDKLRNKNSGHTAEGSETRGVLNEITRKKFDSQTETE